MAVPVLVSPSCSKALLMLCTVVPALLSKSEAQQKQDAGQLSWYDQPSQHGSPRIVHPSSSSGCSTCTSRHHTPQISDSGDSPGTGSSSGQQQVKTQLQAASATLSGNLQGIGRALSLTTVAAASPPPEKKKGGIPVYGNWCGPKHGSGTPVDEIDDCCRRHDKCYSAKKVYLHCTCDQDIIACLRAVQLKSRARRLRALRSSMVTYFSNTACRCERKGKLCMPVKKCSCPDSG